MPGRRTKRSDDDTENERAPLLTGQGEKVKQAKKAKKAKPKAKPAKPAIRREEVLAKAAEGFHAALRESFLEGRKRERRCAAMASAVLSALEACGKA